MRERLVAYKGRGVQPWRWRLVARNGRIIADCAEGYSSRDALAKALQRLRLAFNYPVRPWVVWK